jgi:son of sevenless-like protein
MHLSEIHTTLANDAMIQLSEKKLSASMGSAKCPLCLKTPGESRRAYVSHVSKHMESIALGALPRESGGETESDSDHCDSVISLQDTTGRQEDADDGKQENSIARKFFGEDPNHNREQEDGPPDFLKLEHEEDILYNMKVQPPVLEGGTLLALVEQLTRHDRLDSSFNNTFLLTYQSFTTARELFELLVKRFLIQPPEGMAQSEYDIWRDCKQKPIRFRVVNILKSWFNNFWIEDQSDETEALIRDVYTFARDTVKTMGTPGSGPLMAVLEQRLRGQDTTAKRLVSTLSQSMPRPILPKNMKKVKFLDIDVTEFARQLTIIESKLYGKIRPAECLNKTWQKKVGENDPEPAPNVKPLILHSRQLINWVAEMILTQFDVKKQVRVIMHFVHVADVSLITCI